METSIDDGVMTITLNRGSGNALDPAAIGGLREAFARAADPAVRGVLLTSSGKLFCPGLDLVEAIDYDRARMREVIREFCAMTLAGYRLERPSVAAIHGHALAGGLLLALTADWRVVSDGARLGLNELRAGAAIPYGPAQILRETVPSAERAAVLALGRNRSGAGAVAAGLAHEIVPSDEVKPLARERLAALCAQDPGAYAITKRNLRAAVVERFERHNDGKLDEFLDAWFAPQARERMLRLAEGLREGKA